ncbi:MAG: hypothetical protein MJ131_09475 [Lachnospiraceae bacterium]|nr:hypothetical protein [Lachnospiraceae bacterium]
MDIKAKIEELVGKIKNDPALLSNFQSDPVKTVEGIVGVDLPDDQINPIVDGIKAKMSMDSLSGVAGKLGGLFK